MRDCEISRLSKLLYLFYFLKIIKFGSKYKKKRSPPRVHNAVCILGSRKMSGYIIALLHLPVSAQAILPCIIPPNDWESIFSIHMSKHLNLNPK